MLGKIIKLTTVPIMFLNFFGGIVGGIWLLIIGGWRLVLLAFFIILISPYIFGLIYLILTPLILLTTYFANKKKTILMMIFAFINMIATSIVNLTWVIWVMSMVLQLHDQGLPLIPLILGGYAVATGPFTYMASKESRDAIGTFVGVYTTQIVYILAIIFVLTGLGGLVIPLAVLIAVGFDIYLLKISYLLQRVQIENKNYEMV